MIKKIFLLFIGFVVFFSPRIKTATLEKEQVSEDKIIIAVAYTPINSVLVYRVSERDSLVHLPYYIKWAYYDFKERVFSSTIWLKGRLDSVIDRLNSIMDACERYFEFSKNLIKLGAISSVPVGVGYLWLKLASFSLSLDKIIAFLLQDYISNINNLMIF